MSNTTQSTPATTARKATTRATTRAGRDTGYHLVPKRGRVAHVRPDGDGLANAPATLRPMDDKIVIRPAGAPSHGLLCRASADYNRLRGIRVTSPKRHPPPVDHWKTAQRPSGGTAKAGR